MTPTWQLFGFKPRKRKFRKLNQSNSGLRFRKSELLVNFDGGDFRNRTQCLSVAIQHHRLWGNTRVFPNCESGEGPADGINPTCDNVMSAWKFKRNKVVEYYKFDWRPRQQYWTTWWSWPAASVQSTHTCNWRMRGVKFTAWSEWPPRRHPVWPTFRTIQWHAAISAVRLSTRRPSQTIYDFRTRRIFHWQYSDTLQFQQYFWHNICTNRDFWIAWYDNDVNQLQHLLRLFVKSNNHTHNINKCWWNAFKL